MGNTSSDSPQSVTVDNIGNATLSLSGLTVGAHFAQVGGSGTPADCTSSSSLAPGGTCNLSLSFTPTATGPITSTATLTVECWCETGFEPKDAEKFAYREGRWRILEAEQPAH